MSSPAWPTAPVPSDDSPTEHLVCAQPGDSHELALIIKRTYRITAAGDCVLADEQVPIEPRTPSYDLDGDPLKPPPPRWDSDLLAFKAATDVILQGHAYAYGTRPETEVELRVGRISRMVRVIGDRRCEWSGGGIRFGPAEPFDGMPLRYDRAYGGYDPIALARYGDRPLEMLGSTEPGWHLEWSTRFHYPRNPCGLGYVVEADRESVEELQLPNLEFPFDPLTPERLAVGHQDAWILGPLPAGFDWYDPGWFPRAAWLGATPDHIPCRGMLPEAAQGWAPADLADRRGRVSEVFDMWFCQAASPGLSIVNLSSDATVSLKNVFPDARERVIRLPGWTPRVKIHVSNRDTKETETYLNAVVIQPDLQRVVSIWSARARVNRPYADAQLAEMRWQIE